MTSSTGHEDVQSLPSSTQFETYVQSIRDAQTPERLRDLTTYLLDPSTPISLAVARPVVNALVDRISDSLELLLHALELIIPRGATFEEQVGRIREALATQYESQGDFSEAARTLQGITLESGQRVISDSYKLRIYVRIMRCMLEEDEALGAETYLNRATLLMPVPSSTTTTTTVASSASQEADEGGEQQRQQQQQQQDAELALHFKLAQARIFDAKRKFIEAAAKYHDLSLSALIPESERLSCLEAAMTCVVLAPTTGSSGGGVGASNTTTMRTRLLGTLYRDERANRVSNPHLYGMLEKMFLDRLIGAKEVESFSRTLKPHQLARLGWGPSDDDTSEDNKGNNGTKTTMTGTTVLGRAVIEHNLLAASHIYDTIDVEALGALLGAKKGRGGAREAERFARGMIETGRLVGEIDQVSGIIAFRGQAGTNSVGNGPSGDATTATRTGEGVETERWDKGIEGLLGQVEACAAQLERKFPDWYRAQHTT